MPRVPCSSTGLHKPRKPSPAPERKKKKKKKRLKAISKMSVVMTHLKKKCFSSSSGHRPQRRAAAYPFFVSKSRINATKSSTARSGQAL